MLRTPIFLDKLISYNSQKAKDIFVRQINTVLMIKGDFIAFANMDTVTRIVEMTMSV